MRAASTGALAAHMREATGVSSLTSRLKALFWQDMQRCSADYELVMQVWMHVHVSNERLPPNYRDEPRTGT